MGDIVIDRGVFTTGGSHRLWQAGLPAAVRFSVDVQDPEGQDAELVLVNALSLKLQVAGDPGERTFEVQDITLLELL